MQSGLIKEFQDGVGIALALEMNFGTLDLRTQIANDELAVAELDRLARWQDDCAFWHIEKEALSNERCDGLIDAQGWQVSDVVDLEIFQIQLQIDGFLRQMPIGGQGRQRVGGDIDVHSAADDAPRR